jgi:hypothetical protein
MVRYSDEILRLPAAPALRRTCATARHPHSVI